jgi:hypothetical protein
MQQDSLQQAYRRAGEDFLAADLECMFRKLSINDPEGVALHNLIQGKIFEMIGQDQIKANMFYRSLAHKLLEKRAKKSFIKQLCEVLIGERQ